MKINLKELSNIKLENDQIVLFKTVCTIEEFEDLLKKYNNYFGDYYGCRIAANPIRNLPDELRECFKSVQDSNFSVDVFIGLPEKEIARFDFSKVTLDIED